MDYWLEVTGLSKTYGHEQVLRNLSFSLAAQRTLSILGRSGSGKTTLLKILAGLEQADTGAIRLGATTIQNLPPNRRNVVYLYQEPLLFSHLNVSENIAFGLRLRRMPDAEIRRRVQELLEELELLDQARKMPGQLSGGQRQRVAFGRALIINPPLLLLDEPFGALDSLTRNSMQELFRRVADEHRITSLFVTHDLKEALLMGDQLALLQNGVLQLYTDKTAFLNDPRTGAKAELSFWENIKNSPT